MIKRRRLWIFRQLFKIKTTPPQVSICNFEELFKEMSERGVKFSKDNVIGMEKLPDGRIIFLETGSDNGGLVYVMRPGSQFEQFGIDKNNMFNFLIKDLRDRNILGYQG